MVLVGAFGQLKFMFMGDLDRQGERNVIHRNPDLRVDVLKLGHHGRYYFRWTTKSVRSS